MSALRLDKAPTLASSAAFCVGQAHFSKLYQQKIQSFEMQALSRPAHGLARPLNYKGGYLFEPVIGFDKHARQRYP